MYCPGEVQGLLSCFHDPMRSFLADCHWWLGQKGEGNLFLADVTTEQTRVRTGSPALTPLWWLTCNPYIYMASSTVLQQMRNQGNSFAVMTWEPSLLPAIDGAGQGSGHLYIAYVTACQTSCRASSPGLMTIQHVSYLLLVVRREGGGGYIFLALATASNRANSPRLYHEVGVLTSNSLNVQDCPLSTIIGCGEVRLSCFHVEGTSFPTMPR